MGSRASVASQRLVRAHPREDVAAAAQAVFEDAIEEVARDLLARTGQRRLAVNGGVLANVKLNQRLAALPDSHSNPSARKPW